MDHKGPERHYDEIESPENGRAIFWQQGEIAPDHVTGEGDFHGEGRPYRGQPNPIEDEMDRYRDMSLDGDAEDEGGNQFRTDKGILASKKDDEEDLEQLDEATEPKGLGETDPVKDNDWPSGEITSRPARDEMLGSVRRASEDEGEEELWDEVVEDFEEAEGGEVKDPTEKIAAAPWLENDGQDSSVPVEHLGWDLVDVVEPSKEYTEASNKYTMPLPQGITDNLHKALIKLNAWVENPEENGKLRPYKDYWSVIRPKVSSDSSVQIGVDDPHTADLINHIARTDDLSSLNTNQHFADTYRVPNPLGPGPVQRIPISPAERQLGQAADAGLPPSGYRAYPSGYGEPTGTRGPDGRILPRTQQQPAGNQAWHDPNLENPPAEWETALAENPNAFGMPEDKTIKFPEHVTDVNKKAVPPAIQLGFKGLQKVLDPTGMAPDYSVRTSFFQALLAPALGVLGRMALPAMGRLVGGAMSKGIGGSLARGVAVNALMNNDQGDSNGGQGLLNIQGPDPTVMTSSIKSGTYGDSFDHPSTVRERNADPVSGSQGIDPHQRPDEDNSDWGYGLQEVNAIGESRDIRGDDYEKHNLKRVVRGSEEYDQTKAEEAIQKFIEALPLIIDYYNSEESGENDPKIQSIHIELEDAFPGYLDYGSLISDDEISSIMKEFRTSSYQKRSLDDAINEPIMRDNADHCMKCNAPIDPSRAKSGGPALCSQHAADQSQAGVQGVNASPDSVNKEFERWGIPTDNNQTNNLDLQTQEFMKQLEQLNNMNITASDTQGPHTDEQQAAVAEYLIEEGREEEIPNMLENPADYDAELAEMQNKQPMLGEDPEDVGMGAQDQMNQMGMGGPEAGGLPGPGMPPPGGPGTPGLPPGMPDMGAPTPADLNPAGPGAMPPPIMASVTSSMLDAAFKYGSDNVAGACPKCDGHTTKMMQQDGKSKCHSCNHEWQDKTFQKSDGDSSHSTTTSSFYAAMDSFVEEEQEPEIDESSHTWTDEDGEPLQEGQEYEIYATNYEIPDIGRVVELKPDAVVYEIESDGGLHTTIEIDRQEADLNGYRFAPTSSGDVEENPSGFGIEDKIAPEPGQDTDLSTPHREIGASAKNAAAKYYMCPEPNCEFNKGGGDYEPGKCSIHNVDLVPAGQSHDDKAKKTAGKHYTPMEQRELIDEYGQARNADKLNLEGTHYADSNPDYFLFGS